MRQRNSVDSKFAFKLIDTACCDVYKYIYFYIFKVIIIQSQQQFFVFIYFLNFFLQLKSFFTIPENIIVFAKSPLIFTQSNFPVLFYRPTMDMFPVFITFVSSIILIFLFTHCFLHNTGICRLHSLMQVTGIVYRYWY